LHCCTSTMCVCTMHYPFYAVFCPYIYLPIPSLSSVPILLLLLLLLLLLKVGVWTAGFRVCLWWDIFCWKRSQTFDGYTTKQICKLSSSNLKKSFENSGLRSEGLLMKGCCLNCGHWLDDLGQSVSRRRWSINTSKGPCVSVWVHAHSQASKQTNKQVFIHSFIKYHDNFSPTHPHIKYHSDISLALPIDSNASSDHQIVQ
jgi:hypothetical protein